MFSFGNLFSKTSIILLLREVRNEFFAVALIKLYKTINPRIENDFI
jgi:hypothetical protein